MSLVMMMDSADIGDFDHTSAINFVDRAMLRAIHLERKMCPRVVIVVEVLAHNAPQMSPIQDDDVVQAFPAYCPDQSLDVGVLPWTSRRGQHFVKAHVVNSLLERFAIDLVVVSKKIRGW